jgi:uncharacterized protein (TIGR00266 family)
MQFKLDFAPSYTIATTTLNPNEEIRVEAGAMVAMSEGVAVETKMEGGLFGGLKRAIGGESFFMNTYKAPAQGGEILLAPALPGDMKVLNHTGGTFYLQSGSFIASERTVQTDTGWGGSRGFFGGAGLILLKVTGQGQILLGCYGAMIEKVLAPGEHYTIDTGHIVGFDGSLQFSVRRVGSWKSTFLSGEGFVCELTGPGRVLIQTRSEESFIGYISSRLPSRSN